MAPPYRRPSGRGLALLATALFGGGMLGGNALVQRSTTPSDGATAVAETVTAAGTYRLSAVATSLAALGVLFLLAAARPRPPDDDATGGADTVAVGAGGAAFVALLLLAGLRYAGPDLTSPGGADADVLAAVSSACSFAAFVALGTALLARPGPHGAVRVLGRVAGACCALGPVLAATVAAADAGAAYGVALASTAVGVLLVSGWGLSLAVRGRRP